MSSVTDYNIGVMSFTKTINDKPLSVKAWSPRSCILLNSSPPSILQQTSTDLMKSCFNCAKELMF